MTMRRQIQLLTFVLGLLTGSLTANAATLVFDADNHVYHLTFTHGDTMAVVVATTERYRAAQSRSELTFEQQASDAYVLHVESRANSQEAVPEDRSFARRDRARQVIRRPADRATVSITTPVAISLKLVNAPTALPSLPNLEGQSKLCEAFWTGYVFDPSLGECLRQAASGCSSPFKHRTKQACESASQ